ncbi:MAG: TIGR00341 family protein [Spirochaetia bacterium]|nr:TIGR00341 family protein [Spirochaetia bacterium]
MASRKITKPIEPGNDSARSKRPMFPLIREFRHLFDLSSGQATREDVIEDIRRSAELRSANLWILLLAILIASIGLNVNATAVIIGAMLISPLMGPITAIGLGVAINDFELMRRSATSLAFAALASVIVSTIYFAVSPLLVEGNELLSRTSPTAWDALIAILGGLAGAVGATRIEKTNVVPGVAIATALMPPLCTAGYGLATGNLKYFGGALYLFYINSICIALGTLIVSRALKYPRVAYMDPKARRKVRRMITAVLVFSLLPSTYFGYHLVKKTIFERNARAFIEQEVSSADVQILNKTVSFEDRRIEVITLGKAMGQADRTRLQTRLVDFGLGDVNLLIRSGLDLETHRQAQPTEEERKAREEANLKQLLAEMKSLYPGVKGLAASPAPFVGDAGSPERLTLVYIQIGALSQIERRKMTQWLEARTGAKIKIVTD